MTDTLIVNARLVNEGREFDGDLRIRDGRIAEIGSGLPAREGETVVDATGRRLLPGMIDDQVHFREPGMEYKADMAVESGAAVAGGLTSFMDMPNTSPPTLDRDALEDKYARAAGRAWGNHGFYMGASNDNLEAVRAIDPRETPGLKVFMGASTGNMLVDDPDTLDGIFRDTPVPIITHCEDTPMIDAELARYREKYGDDIPARCHPDIRSREACIKSTRLALELARRHGTRLHVLHISTADELALFEAGPLVDADGRVRKRITAETCIHFLRFAREDYDRLGPRRPAPRDRRGRDRRAGHRPRAAHAAGKAKPLRARAQRPAAGAVRAQRRAGVRARGPLRCRHRGAQVRPRPGAAVRRGRARLPARGLLGRPGAGGG